MITAYLFGEFLRKPKETILRIYSFKSSIENMDNSCSLIESGDREGLKVIRKSIWPCVNVCVLCYDIENYVSFENIKKKVSHQKIIFFYV